jgi:hypothetical protein
MASLFAVLNLLFASQGKVRLTSAANNCVPGRMPREQVFKSFSFRQASSFQYFRLMQELTIEQSLKHNIQAFFATLKPRRASRGPARRFRRPNKDGAAFQTA